MFRGQYPTKLVLLRLPMFVEETGGSDFAGPTTVGRRVKRDDGPVREFGRLFGVGAISIGPEINAAVQNYVAVRIQWIGENQNGGVVSGIVALTTEGEPLACPFQREFIEHF